MRIIDQHLLDELTSEAMQNPRQRKNRNFHPGDDYPCHRLLNAIEPESYIRPHCHLDPAKDETMLIVRGSMAVLYFAADGKLEEKEILTAGGAKIGVDIPHGILHTVISLEQGTIFLEAKGGPYLPLTSAELPDWAPAEGTAAAVDYFALLQRMARR